jgi:hypothetical protein
MVWGPIFLYIPTWEFDSFNHQLCPKSPATKSSGFGGTNSRGEVWAMSRAVQSRKTQEALGRSRTASIQKIAAVTLPCAAGMPHWNPMDLDLDVHPRLFLVAYNCDITSYNII